MKTELPSTLNRQISGSLRRIEGFFPQYTGLADTISKNCDGNTAHMTIELLLTAAIWSTEKDRQEMFLSLATQVDSQIRRHDIHYAVDARQSDVEHHRYQELFNAIGERRLSNGKLCKDDIDESSKSKAEKKVRDSLDKINKPLKDEIVDITRSLTDNLTKKQQRLAQTTDDEEKQELQYDSRAIQANLGFLQRLQEMNSSWDNFEEHLRKLTQEVQGEFTSKDQVDPESETRLQALSSLKSQLQEKARQRKNANTFIYGNPEKPGSGIIHLAIAERRKRLSENKLDTGEYEINAMSAKKLGEWIAEQLTLLGLSTTVSSITKLYEQSGGDPRYFNELLTELGFSEQSPISEFVTNTYCVRGHKEHADAVRAKVASIYSQELEDHLGLNIRDQHDNKIMTEICERVETIDLVSAVQIGEKSELFSDLKSAISCLIEALNIEDEQKEEFFEQNQEKLIKVLLAYYELTRKANDRHINAAAVIRNLGNAVFKNQPISLQTVRCLRWCYPNKVLEIAPHGGDWSTKDTSGRPILRRESTEEEKLKRWKNAVIDPIAHHGIPIKDITLVAAGDYDLLGPGFGYTESDEPVTNARKYVEDLEARVAKWGLFNGYEVKIRSFKTMAERYGRKQFDELLLRIQQYYDGLSQNHRQNFAGYNDQEIERLVNAEHETRMPYIEGWNRKRSRELTRHKLCMELALGVAMSSQQLENPILLTVSGTQPAALSFGRGHLIPDTSGIPLPITLFKSINDGEQPVYYQGASEVVQ